MNCLIIGDKFVGKSTFIAKHKIGIYINDYVATTTVQTTNLNFNTNHGIINLTVYDCGSNPEHGSLGLDYNGDYPNKVDCALIMFDITNSKSFDRISIYLNWVFSRYGEIPIVLCGNKTDLKKRKILQMDISSMVQREKLTYYDISVKTNHNLEHPLLYLMKKVTGNDDLEL